MGKKYHKKFKLSTRSKKELAHDLENVCPLEILLDINQSPKKIKPWLSFLATHLLKHKYSYSFYNLVLITHKLAQLPAEYFAGEQRKLLTALTARISYALERKANLHLAQGYAILFHALLKLPLDFLRYQYIFVTLAYKCLESFFSREPDIKNIKDLGFTPQSLWIISSIAHLQFPQDPQIDKLFAKIKDLVTSSSHVTQKLGSDTQAFLTTKIRKLLSPPVQTELKIEYPLGIYHLDIALPEQKIAIEVDGKQHYTNRRLKNSDIVRDFITEHMFGWKTIRLPHFEYGRALHYSILSAYLLHKLSSHSSILSSSAATLHRASHTWHSCFFRPKLKTVSQKTEHKKPSLLAYKTIL